MSLDPNVTEINELSQFLELRSEWNKLLEESRDNHVLLTWEFLSTVWKHYGRDKKLRILCVRDKNRTTAIAPLRESRYNLGGLIGYTVIEPLAYRYADYTGLILTQRESHHLRLFLTYLAERDDWDFIYMYDFPETSPIQQLLPRISKDIRVKSELVEGVVCPYMIIPRSMGALMREFGANFRYNLRRYERKLEKEYQKVRLKKYNEFDSVENAMKTFMKLHQKRWNSKGVPGVYDTQDRRQASLDVARVLADNGWLALYFLTVSDEPIAGLLCFEYGRKMYGGLSGFDPDYSQYSVGNILFAKVIEKCVEKGIMEFDFMKGGEAYKFKYTTQYRRNFGIKLVNRKLTSNLYHLGIRGLKKMRLENILGHNLRF